MTRSACRRSLGSALTSAAKTAAVLSGFKLDAENVALPPLRRSAATYAAQPRGRPRGSASVFHANSSHRHAGRTPTQAAADRGAAAWRHGAPCGAAAGSVQAPPRPAGGGCQRATTGGLGKGRGTAGRGTAGRGSIGGSPPFPRACTLPLYPSPVIA